MRVWSALVVAGAGALVAAAVGAGSAVAGGGSAATPVVKFKFHIRPIKPHGPAHKVRQIRYSDGKLNAETTYEYGVKNGPYKSYFENGDVSLEGQYVDGLQQGVWKQYTDHGKLLLQGTYKDGLLTGDRLQYGDGGGPMRGRRVVVRREHLRLGVKDGPAETYYNSGRLTARGTYRLGRKEGTWTFFGLDGKGPIRTKEYVCGRARGAESPGAPPGAKPCPPPQIQITPPSFVKRPGESMASWRLRVTRWRVRIEASLAALCERGNIDIWFDGHELDCGKQRIRTHGADSGGGSRG